MARPRRLQPDPDIARCQRTGCPSPTHDTESAYAQGCRSSLARARGSRYRKAGRLGLRAPRLVAALGPRRRLQALMALGHPGDVVADRIGISRRSHSQLITGTATTCHWSTERAIRAVYEELAEQPGSSGRVRAEAARRGYARPDEWWPGELDDPGADPRATEHFAVTDDGDTAALLSAAKYRGLNWSTLTYRDQDRVIEGLRGHGMSYAQIAELLALDGPKAVERIAERITRRRRRAAA